MFKSLGVKRELIRADNRFVINNVKEGSSIKCFVWDSLQSLEPLSEAISITVPNN